MLYAHRNKRQSEQTAKPEKYPQGYFKEKPCRLCGIGFVPNAPSHLYCSQSCADKALSSAYLERTYNITLNDYNQMLEKQDHRCSICDGEGFLMDRARHKVKLVVDHDHTTGQVRGLLCHNCNRALGLLQENPEIVSSALDYLKVQRLSSFEE